ncbi:hypothetical protein G6O69_15550 [Pseudenhygromyxa sp. WMMC2535]|nr:hypothetical protein [Pseudenhygromyxa sp. WMMC2535]NVB39258.1 hypothetical protein [Pseudenhygromyxa sp. WMMC2535]
MAPTTAAAIVFALMWTLILYSGFRLYRWLFRLDRQAREGEAPIRTGL